MTGLHGAIGERDTDEDLVTEGVRVEAVATWVHSSHNPKGHGMK